MSDPIVPIDNSTAQDLEMFFLKQQRDQAQEDAAFWKLKYEAEELEKAALQSRLDALSQPDDEDAPTPAGLRAANARLHKDRQMYSALVGQLRVEIQEEKARLDFILDLVREKGTNGLQSFLWTNPAEADPLEADDVILDRQAIDRELRSLREAKQLSANPETPPRLND